MKLKWDKHLYDELNYFEQFSIVTDCLDLVTETEDQLEELTNPYYFKNRVGLLSLKFK